MFINRISFDDYNKTSFRAANLEEVKLLTEKMSKKIYGKQAARELYMNNPAAEGITLGTTGLPTSWIKRIKDISQFDLMSFCEKLGRIFTEDRLFSNIDNMNTGIQRLFTHFGIIEKDDKLKVSYLNKGFFGRAYKIDLFDNEPKVMKEYKTRFRYQNNHGNYAEQNIAEYIARFSGKNTNMAKYYYGDTSNAIMLLDFISEDTPLPQNMVELDELGLAYDDGKPRNLINQYIIDYGGIITISNLIGNKEAQNVYRDFKYLEDNDKKRILFDEIINNSSDEKYKDKLIGLTHSIKFFPLKEQEELYKKMYEFKDRDINIAIIENFKNFHFTFDNDIIKRLSETEDSLEKEILAREIRHIPASIMHPLMEKLSLEDNNTIKKYLARKLNYYYKNPPKRIEIYDNLMKNADSYANIALINSLDNLPLKERDSRFAKFMALDDMVVNCALVRNIETFKNDEPTMTKWVHELMKHDDIRVKRALCESVRYMPENLMVETFENLLDIQDMVAKEYLAETLTSIPHYSSNPDWFDKIFEASGNAVKRELAKALKDVDSPILKEKWSKKLIEFGDSSVKEILHKQGLA